MSAKIVERSPLKYHLVRYAASVAPASVLQAGTVNERNFAGLVECIGLVECLYTSQNITATVADTAKMQYSKLINVAQTEMKTLFENFVPGTTRLDEFNFNRLDNQREYAELWRVIKLILILSHGNAAVESGFSVNGDMLVENLHESSLVAQKTVFDSISYAGGVFGVSVDKRMMQYVRGARSRYDDAMKAS